MFKSLTVFKSQSQLAYAEDAFEARSHHPIEASSEKSAGFIPPRGEHHQFFEQINGALILSVMIETKTVPKSVLDERVKKACEAIEQTTGRKPGKKERQGLRDEAYAAMLPTAFPKQTRVDVMLKDGYVYVGSTSSSKVDEVLSLLVRAIPGIELNMIQTTINPSSYMMIQLAEGDGNLHVGRELHLEAIDESKAKVKYTNHPVCEMPEVLDHIKQGKVPTALAFSNDNISFVMTAGMQLKKIEADDKIIMASKQDREDAFDGSWFMASTYIPDLVESLIGELGGLIEQEDE